MESSNMSVGNNANDPGLIYNDELLEMLSESILLGTKPGAAYLAALPEIKKALFEYDIYMLSFLSDEDIDRLADAIKSKEYAGGRITDKKLKTKLLAIRDNAKTFVDIATKYNSVRAFIDRSLSQGDKEEAMAMLIGVFTDNGSEYKLKQVGAISCKKFLGGL
jgi:3-methyladenine DNA glycosylase Tag